MGRTSDIKVHTVVDHLLRKSDSGSQIVVATLRELEARCLVNPKQGRTHVIDSLNPE